MEKVVAPAPSAQLPGEIDTGISVISFRESSRAQMRAWIGAADGRPGPPSHEEFAMSNESIRDRLDIVELCARVGWHLDHCEWDLLLDSFTDEVSLDYTSLNGGDVLLLSREDVIGKWRTNREGLAATQHLIANQIVDLDGDMATATAMFQATHLLPNRYGAPTWTLGGRYRYGMTRTAAGWRISSLAMSVIWADGNRHIRDLAKGAAAT
jgi:hypothetical protein